MYFPRLQILQNLVRPRPILSFLASLAALLILLCLIEILYRGGA
jgi:hypothetical protein